MGRAPPPRAARTARTSRSGRRPRSHGDLESLDKRELLAVLLAFRRGDLGTRLRSDLTGIDGKIADALNNVIRQSARFSEELHRVSRAVGEQGQLAQRVSLGAARGGWSESVDSVNALIVNLAHPTAETARVVGAVARGDLSQKIALQADGRPLRGEFLATAHLVNDMVTQLGSLTSELTRVAREVGTEGKLGGQAEVRGVSGSWRDLTDNVNRMATNLTDQVRGITRVVAAVAHGDLKRKLGVEARGEIAALSDTINSMIETLATFADQVTTVAHEVGVRGQLGGQASVPGAAGTWKHLTDNVNQLAHNLTTQMRAIAEVATAVTKGDLTRSIGVEARGEVAALKDDINEMIRHLRDTTQKNSDQDWLKTNLAKFSRMLQGEKELRSVGRLLLSELAPVVTAQYGVFYVLDVAQAEPELRLLAGYAHRTRAESGPRIRLGEGLVGQCALAKQKIVLHAAPPDYIRISSGLGEVAPVDVIVLPVCFEGRVMGVLELASLETFTPTQEEFLEQLTETIGIVLNTIEVDTRTEDLLKQSQSLAIELQHQQEELRQTNQQIEEKAVQLAQQNVEMERKNQEIEQARKALEDKAEQLTLTSKYKSEFLANVSHELRTPLNSLLILADELSKNADGNLTPRQTEFAKTIHASGADLLMLINDILDLAKIESGTVSLDVQKLRFGELLHFVERTFRHVAAASGLRFTLHFAPDLPRALRTDPKRLQQVLKNLLSNAFKFTERGTVELRVERAQHGWSPDCETLNRARAVVAISVRDTGIGIPDAKQRIIFEAFQQADGSTSRRYGGTGLGLAISREIANRLGGDIQVTSAAGQGSTFTLYLPVSLPVSHVVPRVVRRRATGPSRGGPALLRTPPPESASEGGAARAAVEDDRESIAPGDRVLLIVDGDRDFASFVLEVARACGWKGVISLSGCAAVALARDLEPAAITLDLQLRDTDGWRVLRLLKADLATRHVPVQVLSSADEAERAYDLAAWSVLAKPIARPEALETALAALSAYVDQPRRCLLVVDTGADEGIAAWLEESLGVRVAGTADTADAALGLADGRFAAAVVVGPEARGSASALLGALPSGSHLPVLCFDPDPLSGGRRASPAQSGVWRVDSRERLLEAAALLLHRRVASLPAAARTRLESLYEAENPVAGKRILVVDDDVRNIFALSSVLEKHGMSVLTAETGRSAIELLERSADVDIVLMDIMMPDIDGLDTTRAIRALPRFASLPIIALTAQAMKGDRERALEAGAWDYLAKPVEPDRMLSVLRAWLSS